MGVDPLDRSQKAKLIDQLNNTLQSAELVVVTRQGGLTVAEVTDLRRQIRAAGAGFKVAKNRLTRRALDGTKFGGISSLLKGPTVGGRHWMARPCIKRDERPAPSSSTTCAGN